jgi:hypothetical protein
MRVCAVRLMCLSACLSVYVFPLTRCWLDGWLDDVLAGWLAGWLAGYEKSFKEII